MWKMKKTATVTLDSRAKFKIPWFWTDDLMGFPGDSVVKNLPAPTGDTGLTPGSGSSPGEGNGNPLQYSCLGKPMDRGA